MMFSTYHTCQGSSPLASAILVISVLLLFVAAMLALLQRRKEIPAWTGPIGRWDMGKYPTDSIWIFDHSQCETAVQWYFEQNKFLKLAWYIALHRSLQRSRDFMLAEDGSSICFSLVSVVKSTRQLKRIQKASVPLCMMEACIVHLAGWLTSPHTFRIT